jgi:hypothetical protein
MKSKKIDTTNVSCVKRLKKLGSFESNFLQIEARNCWRLVLVQRGRICSSLIKKMPADL